MAPPEFNDIGKTAKDILSGKDVDLNKTKFVYKTVSTHGAEVTGTLEKGKDSSLTGEIKSKFNLKDTGLTITDTLKSDSSINVKLEAPKVADGLKLDSEFSFNAEKSKETKFGLTYKGDSIAFTSGYNVFQNPKLTADLVFESHGLLVGGQASVDVATRAVEEFKTAFGYSEEDYQITVLAENKLSRFTVGYSHKVNKEISVAGQAAWGNAGGLLTSFALKYQLPGGAILLNKFTSAGIFSLGYSRKIHSFVKLSLGLEINTAANPSGSNADAHMYGFGLTFEPK